MIFEMKPRSLAWICIAGIVSSTFHLAGARSALHIPMDQQTQQSIFTVSQTNIRVPVILGVMSQCPDAILCESVFDDVIQQVEDKIDLSLTFIGHLNNSEPDYGVTCMHGRGECAGNIQELCAIKYEETPVWWKFVQCQNAQGRWKVGLPETVSQCAEEAEIDWENGKTGQCAGRDHPEKSEEGVELLKQSIQLTKSLGIEKSCTILFSGRAVCVHDETWKECEGGHAPEDFIKQIEEEYAKINAGAKHNGLA